MPAYRVAVHRTITESAFLTIDAVSKTHAAEVVGAMVTLMNEGEVRDLGVPFELQETLFELGTVSGPLELDVPAVSDEDTPEPEAEAPALKSEAVVQAVPVAVSSALTTEPEEATPKRSRGRSRGGLGAPAEE